MLAAMRSKAQDGRHVSPAFGGGMDDADVPERELRALLRILSAVAGAQALEAVIEVAAEQALVALDVSSVSVSRWDRAQGTLQTLANVGHLAPGEELRPEAEVYPLSQFPRAFDLLSRGRPHLARIDDPDLDDQERGLLADLGKESSIAVPIVSDGQTWGELYATLAPGGRRRFDGRDLRFLAAVAGQVSASIARGEAFSRMTRFAFEDPLTGLANRRALEERLDPAIGTALRTGGDVTLVLCDLDGLKATNDLLGHEAGDRRLVTTAEALRATAATRQGAFPARIGGDEFCLLLDGEEVAEGQRVAEELRDRLGVSGSSPVTVSCGVAALGLGPRSAAELLRLADAAQYRAKRAGPGRICVAGAELLAPALQRPLGRTVRENGLGTFERLVTETVALLDASGAPVLERLAAVADACSRVVSVESWSLSQIRPGTELIETVMSGEPILLGGRALRRFSFPGEVYALADFPATRAILLEGGVLLSSIEDPDVDPDELALMVERGWEQVLAVAVEHAGTTTLVELFADGQSGSLTALAPFARVLLAHAAAS